MIFLDMTHIPSAARKSSGWHGKEWGRRGIPWAACRLHHRTLCEEARERKEGGRKQEEQEGTGCPCRSLPMPPDPCRPPSTRLPPTLCCAPPQPCGRRRCSSGWSRSRRHKRHAGTSSDKRTWRGMKRPRRRGMEQEGQCGRHGRCEAGGGAQKAQRAVGGEVAAEMAGIQRAREQQEDVRAVGDSPRATASRLHKAARRPRDQA